MPHRTPPRPAAPIAALAAALGLGGAACDLTDPPAATYFDVPIAGESYADWFYGPLPNHDVEPDGAEDYMCGVKTIVFRRTTDFLLPSLREMDRGVDVLAAAPGEVVRVNDGEPDRNLEYRLQRPGNQVWIRHADGLETGYRYLKQGSIRVGRGERVEAGQVIAQAGSSGNSNWPRLGFEVRDQNGDALDPWAGACSGSSSFWTEQPDYPNEFTVVDLGTTDQPAFLSVVANRPPDVTTFQRRQQVTFWVHTVNRPVGELSLRLLGPDATLDSAAITLPVPDPANTVFGGFLVLGDSAQLGTWAVEYAMNGERFARLAFDVVAAPAAFRTPDATGAPAGGVDGPPETELRVDESLRLQPGGDPTR